MVPVDRMVGTMVVAVCGACKDFDKLRAVLDALHPDCVVHGDTSRADKMAGRWADARGVNVIPFPADWRKFRKAAGPIRNSIMLEAASPDVVVAFPGGGSDDMVAKAYDMGIPVLEVK